MAILSLTISLNLSLTRSLSLSLSPITNPNPNPYRKAWRATLDVMLLARCDALVGKFSSNLFRTAHALQAAACDCARPFVSLDAPWCSDYPNPENHQPVSQPQP